MKNNMTIQNGTQRSAIWRKQVEKYQRIRLFETKNS